MNLGQEIVKKLLSEDTKIKTVVAIYPGRFQPMGRHHAKTFKWLQSKFGASDSYVATSDKSGGPKNPFSFNDKKKVINKHGIKNVVKVKNPYQAQEILKKYDPETTAVVFMVGSKDMGDDPRFKIGLKKSGGKTYYQDYNKNKNVLEGYDKHGYLIIAPHVSFSVPGYGEMSGTAIRKALGSSMEDQKKQKLFKDIMGYFDRNLYNMIVGKLGRLSDAVELFLTKNPFSELIKEGSMTSKAIDGDADDGPPTYFSTFKGYSSKGNIFAQQLGWEVIDYILDGAIEIPPVSDRDVVDSVSYFPAGAPGAKVPTNNSNFRGRPAYLKWVKRMKMVAQVAGYKMVKDLSALASISSSKSEPNKIDEVPDNILEDLQNEASTAAAAPGTKGYKAYATDFDEDEREKWYSEITGWGNLNEGLLVEGGAYGHMAHPFDDKGLTFGDFKNIIDQSLQGGLDLESAATEKTDGQNLYISWNKNLIAARNTGDIKRGGLDIKAVAAKFKDRGNIEKAFNYAMQDLSKAIGSLSDEQRNKIFDEGNNWVNMEIIYPPSQNVISYDAPYLQFHNVLKYDNGTAVGSVQDGARILSGMITQVNQNVQKNFSVIGPKVLKMKPNQNFAERRGYFIAKLKKEMSKLGMKDNNSFAEYHQAWWENYIDKNIGNVENNIKMGLVKRWAFFDKSFRLNKKNIPDADVLAKAVTIDKQKHIQQVKKNMFPFETLFFELGAEVLKNVEGYLAANPDKAVQNVRKQIAKAITDVRKGGDIKKLNKIKDQLAKIKAIGGFKTIIPSEGLVFIYKGKTYKLTGSFAPINQITGLMTF